MNTAAILHRPESEYAYLYKKDLMHIRIRTGRGDIKHVELIHGDPYQLDQTEWFKQSNHMTKGLTTSTHDYWEIELTAPFRRLSYAFKIEAYDGSILFFGEHGFSEYTDKNLKAANNYFRLPYFHEADRFTAPDWVKETVWYQIFPERFANGDLTNDPEGTLAWGSKEHPDREDFFGGDLQGVIDHLDHLVELGINGIYFCPIFKAHSNHKYDTIDYLEIDPDFGDKALFKQLVDECHQRGIKVMLDAVFNHMGDVSPQWQDVIAHGADSPFADWFHIHDFPVSYTETEDFEFSEDINYDTFAFTPHMPKLNTANKEVQEYLLTIGKYWIEEFNIDAWRLDVANEVDHRFWKKFYDACTTIKPDIYILGEIWHSSQRWLEGDEFHAVMNYPFTDAITAYFLHKTVSLPRMMENINAQLMLYREQTNQVMFNVLDSHDTPRLLTLAENNKELMKQVLAFTYLQKGLPCLYYGDEFGMNGAGDPDCRKCMVWEKEQQDTDMFNFIKTLIATRKAYQPILSEGKLIWTKADETTGLIEYCYQTPHHTLRATFNSGNNAITLNESTGVLSYLTHTTDHTLTIEPFGFNVSLINERTDEES
ncbi:glycoside hydrolase family 13 protein [Vagococcus xieshaowenii]|uniref:Alpha-glycosidase n=1 Tax=Vagococcus xieshaowenii TaxID=2562451 RepID=A0AAJ5EDJ4_9ENTE|nr:glycoside hydrolase family 13 protein [Vagococcus xieshaowenii]QCA28119.1 alpha-glycosidase [Vagococcus xieshaowenii]TFZ40162.1 alpha-glycosidase [Vagococcus xieshaowenii]